MKLPKRAKMMISGTVFGFMANVGLWTSVYTTKSLANSAHFHDVVTEDEFERILELNKNARIEIVQQNPGITKFYTLDFEDGSVFRGAEGEIFTTSDKEQADRLAWIVSHKLVEAGQPAQKMTVREHRMASWENFKA